MELTDHLGYKCTDDGLKLLERYPDFIESVWLNPDYRKSKFNVNKNFFTIEYDGNAYIEKNGTSFREFFRYERAEDLIKAKGLSHIRVAKTYFGDNDRILLEYCGKIFDPDEGKKIEMFTKEGIDLPEEYKDYIPVNKQAFEEWYELKMAVNHIEFCIQPNGDLIVIDPHI